MQQSASNLDSRRIVVVSLNPSVDVEWSVPKVVWEEKNNILSERRWAGGKGVNVARWLRHLGGDPLLVLPLGGATGQEMQTFLSKEQLPHKAFWIRETTRANIIVTTAGKKQLRFNPLGPELTPDEWTGIYRFAEEVTASLVICSGALPRNAAGNTYHKLIEVFTERGIPCILDCDGAPFVEGVQAKPLLVKPNRFELAQWCGRELREFADVISVAKELAALTTRHVMVSLGAEGALLIWNGEDGIRALRAASPNVHVLNTIGAGDSMLAGAAFALTQGRGAEDCLSYAIATSTAAVSKPAGALPSPHEVEQFLRQIKVQKL